MDGEENRMEELMDMVIITHTQDTTLLRIIILSIKSDSDCLLNLINKSCYH